MKRINSLDDLYNKIQESLVYEIEKDMDLKKLWKQLNILDEQLEKSIEKSEYKIFDNYLSKESEVIDLERKRAFVYGYKLANKFMTESFKE